LSCGIAKGEKLFRRRRENLMQERNANRKDGSETREEAKSEEEDGEAISVGLRRCGFR